MNHLILIRHAHPQIDETKPATKWQLSDEGQKSCKPLANALKPFTPDLIFTSTEKKAQETGQLTANHLQIPCTTAPNLHEHDRTGFPFISDKQKWHNTVASFFNHPDELVFGKETATQACNRFTKAVETILHQNPHKNIAIATHGTVISLFVGQKTQTNGFDLWQKWGMPAIIVFDLPSYKLNAMVPQIS